MKSILFKTATLSVALSSASLADDVGISVSIGQPEFYGRIFTIKCMCYENSRS